MPGRYVMQRFTNILLIAAGENWWETALERAVSLARENQANLTVVDVLELSGDLQVIGRDKLDKFTSEIVGKRLARLDNIVQQFQSRVAIQTKVIQGTAFLEIIREVLRNRHDLVIRIPETLDWLNRLFGSDDMHLMRKCPCPVWLIRPQEPKSYKRILAAVDVDDAYPPAEMESRRALNRQILEMASSLALSEFAELHILSVWHAIGESAMRGAFMYTPEEKIIAYVEQVRRQHEFSLDRLVREVTSNLGQDAMGYLKPQTHLLKGWARKEVPALAKRIEADLVVMGTVVHTGIPGFFMGNTAETILDQIDCSVLAIKPSGFVTPVTLEA